MQETQRLICRIADRSGRIAVIGLGYVGLPLAMALCDAGFRVTGFDIDPEKIVRLHRGQSYIGHIPSEEVGARVRSGQLEATSDFERLPECDAILICVPTPLTRNREPDMRYVEGTAESISRHLRRGQLVVLESSTYPGTTDELVRPILERSGLRYVEDFLLAFSPEREDPGNLSFSTARIPKVVGADDPESRDAAVALYSAVMQSVAPVSGSRTAESVKLLENIFRAVNVGLVNELKVIFDVMGVDIWEVIEAAKTKPFGFMPFYPGPGLGGHCIPIDPFYLTWKAREFEIPTRLVEVAGEINTAMPAYVVDRTARALSDRSGKALKGSRILLLGLSYKKNIDDIRESPALKIAALLEDRGVEVLYHDPHRPEIPATREYGRLKGKRSEPLSRGLLEGCDAVVVVTDHDDVDYALVVAHAKLIVDSRNAIAARVGAEAAAQVVRA